MAEERFDPYLLNIANNQNGGIDGLLEIYFSFLRRKTDFFSGGGEGYPRVEKTIQNACKRQYDIYQKEIAAKEAKQRAAKQTTVTKGVTSTTVETSSSSTSVPGIKSKETNSINNKNVTTNSKTPTNASIPSSSSSSSSSVTDNTGTNNNNLSSTVPKTNETNGPKKAPPATTVNESHSTEVKKVDDEEEELVYEPNSDGVFDIGNTTSTTKKYPTKTTTISSTSSSTSSVSPSPIPPVPSSSSAPPSNSSSSSSSSSDTSVSDKVTPSRGNGLSTAKYSWTQTLNDITITIPVPSTLKSRDIVVDMKTNTLKIGIKNQPPIFDGKLHKKIRPNDCSWTFESAESTGKIDSDGTITSSTTSVTGMKTVLISLQKDNEMEWWSTITEGEPEIDITKIEPENSKLSDLDGETRKVVEKMMFDQQQKAKGLPSSDELQKQSVLEKFMAAHPEMDFSNAKIN